MSVPTLAPLLETRRESTPDGRNSHLVTYIYPASLAPACFIWLWRFQGGDPWIGVLVDRLPLAGRAELQALLAGVDPVPTAQGPAYVVQDTLDPTLAHIVDMGGFPTPPPGLFSGTGVSLDVVRHMTRRCTGQPEPPSPPRPTRAASARPPSRSTPGTCASRSWPPSTATPSGSA